MTDKLTQLQDSLDGLLDQMRDALYYIQSRHPYGDIPGQPTQAPEPASASTPHSAGGGALTNGQSTQSTAQQQDQPGTPAPETPDRFNHELHVMARDLVTRQGQIEMLINSLPGIGVTEEDQDRRMRQLEVDLRELEKERERAEGERERMADLLGQMIVGTKRVS